MYDEPTVRDLDYPRIGVRRTHHDERRHVLEVDTYAATASQRRTLDDLHRRQPAAHDTSIKVDVDGRDCDTWGRSRRGAVAIDLTVGTHRISLTYA